jgi:amino acid adenylation domain-containing protein
LQKVVDRHAILRTVFPTPALETPVQVVSNSIALVWGMHDLSALDSIRQDQEVTALALAERKRPYDVEHGPLLRPTLVALAEQRYVLLLSASALCADAGSLCNLIGELSRFYASDARASLDRPYQYTDYANWQNELLAKQDNLSGKAYWRDASLASTPPVMLPFQTKPDNLALFEPDSVAVKVDPESLASLRQMGRESGVSPADFWSACWSTLIWRFTSQAEIVIEHVLDGRRHPETVSALGPYAKPLPIRCAFDPAQPFDQMVHAMRAARADATTWQDDFPSDASGNAASAIGFDCEGTVPPTTADGIVFSVYQQFQCVNRFSIQLCCFAHDSSWDVQLQYDPQAFDRGTVELLAEHLAVLVSSVTHRPSAPIGEVGILGATHRRQLLVDFNQTAARYPQDRCIHELFEEQAVRTPERTALVYKGQKYTFAQLNTKANQLARAMRRRGIVADKTVGLFMDRSAEMIIGLWGILKAGGAYVPLNTDHPKARLAHQLTESEASVVVTKQALLDRLPECAGQIVCFDRDRLELEAEEPTNLGRVNGPGDRIYVIYTSGSTGLPKGVATTHRNIVNYTDSICRKLQVSTDGGLSFAMVTTVCADLASTCIYPPAVSGGCLHIIPEDVALDPTLYARYAVDYPIDVLKTAPSHLSALLNSVDAAGILPRRYLIVGGEACSWQLVQKVSELSRCTMINHYAPTETTCGSLTCDIAKSTMARELAAVVPLGRPIGNTQLYVLDDRLQPVPIGVAGQLFISGDGVSRGYVHQPGLTADRFVPNPFSENGGARMYRSGDLVRYLPEGSVEFLGRLDDQVKIRGFRVEPLEIEAVLKQHPEVEQAVVMARRDHANDVRLVAYVGSSSHPTADSLREFLQKQLPNYMIPSSFVVLDRLPLNANGKVDRQSLPALEQVTVERAAPQAETMAAAQNPIQETLVKIWSEVLGVENIGIHDNFFDLGGHSLLATQVIARVRRAFGVHLPLSTLFDGPTVSEQAEAIIQMEAEKTDEGEMDALLEELKGLSPDEIQRFLSDTSEANKE